MARYMQPPPRWRVYVGIDPGVGGGIAALSDDPSAAVRAWPMPETERDILDRLDDASHDADVVAVIERASASPQMGVSSAFKFGGNYYALRMALTSARIPFDSVTSSRWQKMLGCISAGDKNVTKRRAQEIFPSVSVTHAIADALLIAEYCRRVKLGQLQPDAQPNAPTQKHRLTIAKTLPKEKLF